MKTKTAGFTLIELLVVISIIGMLSSIVLVSLREAREKAIEANLRVTLYELNVAAHSYYNDHGEFPPIPIREGTPPGTGGALDVDADQFLEALRAGNYISTIPPLPVIDLRYVTRCSPTTPCGGFGQDSLSVPDPESPGQNILTYHYNNLASEADYVWLGRACGYDIIDRLPLPPLPRLVPHASAGIFFRLPSGLLPNYPTGYYGYYNVLCLKK